MASEDVLERANDFAAELNEADKRRRMTDLGALHLIHDLAAEVRELRERKDGAYYERNQVVAALAKCFPSGTARTAIEGWSEDWHGCVYIDLPTGQVSWHFHDSHAHLFAGLPPYSGSWDGHDTPEKYRRLGALDGDLRKDKARLDWLDREPFAKSYKRALDFWWKNDEPNTFREVIDAAMGGED